MDSLKRKIVEFTKDNHSDYSKIERQAGLTKNFISNIIYGKSKNPGIESMIKLADVFNVSIDELVGKVTKEDLSQNIAVENKKIFVETMTYVLNAIKTREKPLKAKDVFKAITSIYNYCAEKSNLDKKFADWYLETYF